MTEIKWCKMHLLWCLEQRDLEKKYNNADADAGDGLGMR